MKTFKSLILALVLFAAAVAAELIWISTGSAPLGFATLIVALAASVALAHCVWPAIAKER